LEVGRERREEGEEEEGEERKGRRGGGLVHPEDKISMTMSGLIAKISQ